MLVIRLFRAGKKNQPFFKVVVTDKKNPPKGGRPLEVLGFYNPLTKEKDFKKERILYWISVGAKPSATVNNLLVSENILKGEKIKSHKKKKVKKESAPLADKPVTDKPVASKDQAAAEPEKPVLVDAPEVKQEDVKQVKPQKKELGQETVEVEQETEEKALEEQVTPESEKLVQEQEKQEPEKEPEEKDQKEEIKQ